MEILHLLCSRRYRPANILQLNSKDILRLVVCRQSVRLGVKPLEAHDQRMFNFSTEPLRQYSLCNILSDVNMGLFVSYEYAWPFVKFSYRT
jgi:hypothetical protein